MLLKNGYTMKMNSIKNCGSNNVIQIDNFDIQLDNDCNIIPKGCVTITKPFKTANVSKTFLNTLNVNLFIL